MIDDLLADGAISSYRRPAEVYEPPKPVAKAIDFVTPSNVKHPDCFEDVNENDQNENIPVARVVSVLA